MAEVTPTYSMNPADYEYDPNVYHLRHIPGVGLYTFGNNESEESIQQATSEISLNAELKYANHHKDPVLLDSFRRYYKRKNGEDFTGTDQETVNEFMSEFSYIDNNLTFGMGEAIIDQTALSEQDKFDVGLLYDRYVRTDDWGEGSRPFKDQFLDVSKALIFDPVNYIGVFTGGVGFAGRLALGKVTTQAAKKALIEGWRKSIYGKYKQAVVKRPITTGMISGAGWASTYDIGKQALEIGSGMQEARHEVTGESESFDYDELLLTAVIGAGFGGAIGGGAKALSKFFSKGTYSNILGKDRTNATTAELRAEMDSRKLVYEDAPLVEAPITISKRNLNKVNKKFNETQEAIDAARLEAEQPTLPGLTTRATKIPEQEYPLNWVNTNGDATKVTVSSIETSRAATMEALGYRGAPEVTQVTLRDQNGVEYKVFADAKGGVNSPTKPPVKQFKSDDDMRSILDEQDIIEIGGTPSGVMKRAHEFLVKNFTSHFGLGPETAERMRDAERVLTSSGEKIDVLIKRFEKAWKASKGTSFDKADRKIHHAFIRALTTNDAKAATDNELQELLPKGSELKEVVEEWRDIIKNASDELINSGAFSKYKLDTAGNPLLDDAGNPIENSFFKTVMNHKKERTYLHRMYSIYEDPVYAKKSLTDRIGEDDYEEIRKYLSKKFSLDPTAAEEVMEAIATPSKQRRLGDLGPLGKKSIEEIDSQYVRTLLGEITDPRQLFAASVFKTKKIVEDYKLKRDLVAIGLRRGTTKPPVMAKRGIRGDWERIDIGASERSFELNNDQLSRMWNNEAKELVNQRPAPFINNPFDGIFVEPEYKRYYDVMANFYDQNVGPVQKLMAGSTFAFNLSKTVLSPTTHMRNFGGGMLQNVYNGILPWGSRAWRNAVSSESNVKGSPTYSVFRRTIGLDSKFRGRKALSDDDTNSITRLIELGILHNGMKAGIFKETYNIMIKDVNPLHRLERKLLGKRRKEIKATAAVDKLAEVYEMSDNINKISAFESEFGWLYRAFGDGKNIEAFVKHAESLGVFNARQRFNSGKEGILTTLIEEASAKKVNMFTPTYSQLSGISRVFRRYPIGNFIAFPMEVTRNYANSWRLAARELRSGSAAMRARGSIRAASLAGATGITVGGIGGFSAVINGITDDEREALESKDMTSPWLYGTNWFYTGKLKDGTLKAIPLGYTDPFSYLSRIAQVAMHSLNENEKDAVLNSRLIDASWEAFKVAIDPYVVPAVGPATLINTYKELNEAYEEEKEINYELIKKSLDLAFNPTVIRDMYKTDLIPFMDAPKLTKWGTEVDPKWHTWIGWVSGMKPEKINISTKVGFALSGVFRDKGANTTEFNKFVGNRQNFEPLNYRENIVQKFKDYIAKEKEIARRVKTIFGHGRTLGLRPVEIVDLATTFDKRIKVGEKKYKASFGQEYIAQINDGEYPISMPSEDILQEIRNTLQNKGVGPGDNLITDLVSIVQQENKDRKIGDIR